MQPSDALGGTTGGISVGQYCRFPRHTGSRNSASGSFVRAAFQEEAGLNTTEVEECEVIAYVLSVFADIICNLLHDYLP